MVGIHPQTTTVTRRSLSGLRGKGGFRANLGESAQVYVVYWFE
jgi:hypothetical protein